MRNASLLPSSLPLVPVRGLAPFHYGKVRQIEQISLRSFGMGRQVAQWSPPRSSLSLPHLVSTPHLTARGTTPPTYCYGWRDQTTGEYSNRSLREQHSTPLSGTASITATDLMVVPGPMVIPVNRTMYLSTGHILPIVAAAPMPWTLHWCRDQDLRDHSVQIIGSLTLFNQIHSVKYGQLFLYSAQ